MSFKLLKNLWAGSFLKITKLQSFALIIFRVFHIFTLSYIFNLKTRISSHYESPQLKTVFLDLKSLEDLKRFISGIGNLWLHAFLGSDLSSFSVFNVSYSAVALLSISVSQIFHISVFLG